MQSRKETLLNYQGLLAAPFTIYASPGYSTVDISSIDRYAAYLKNAGVNGVFVNGTTGESVSLSVAERKTTAAAWVESARRVGLELVIIQVGASALADVRELAHHAEQIGAHAVASLPPLYYKTPEVESMVDYFAEIGKACPSLPLLLYHFPEQTGGNLPPPSAFLTRCSERLPQVCGAKFTSADVRELAKCLRVPGMKIMTGHDETLLPAMSLGVTAAVGASYNFIPHLSVRLMEQVRRGQTEEARNTQQQIADVVHIAVAAGHQPISGLKALMNHVGPFNVGDPRPPLYPLNPDQHLWIDEALRRNPVPNTRGTGHDNHDISSIDRYAAYLKNAGVNGVFVNGTTGESVSLSVAERKTTAAAWVESARRVGLELVIIQVGASALADVRELAHHAEQIGAHAVASLPPLYYKTPEVESMVDYFAEIGKACPSLPLLLYHFPEQTGGNLPPPSAFLTRCSERLPQVCGAKFTSADVRELAKCLRIPGMKIMTGHDETLLPAMSLGVTAAVGASYNFIPHLSVRLMEQVRRGQTEEARNTQQQISDVVHIAVAAGHQPISGLKALMNHVGPFNVGDPRPPLYPLNPDQHMWIDEALRRNPVP
ncbi:hypothetical protein LAZ67_21002397, partial [Cordylochernes scorpioides]